MRFPRLWSFGLSTFTLCAVAYAGPVETEHKKIDRTDETSLVTLVDFGAGSLDLHKGSSGLIVDATVTYDRKYIDFYTDYKRRRSVGYLEMASDLDGAHISGRLKNDWDVGLTDAIPIELELDIGAAEAQLDLSGLAVTRLDLEIGAADAEIWWNQPNGAELEEISIECGASSLHMEGLGDARFAYFDFEGGVGSFEIDFGGTWTRSARCDFEVGLGSLELRIPDHIGVRIDTDDSFLSSVDVDREYREVDDGRYESDHYEDADVQLEIHVQLGMGSVEVHSYRP
jgi:hypothetical protein